MCVKVSLFFGFVVVWFYVIRRAENRVFGFFLCLTALAAMMVVWWDATTAERSLSMENSCLEIQSLRNSDTQNVIRLIYGQCKP